MKSSRLKKICIWVLGVVLILSLLVYFLLPKFAMDKGRSYDSYARSDLSSLWMACVIYWDEKGEEGNCTVDSAKEFGFTPYDKHGYVTLKIIDGKKNSFLANATHNARKTPTVWKIDANGKRDKL